MRKTVLLVTYFVANVFIISTLYGKKPPKEQKSTLLVGFYGGINFSKPQIINSYNILETMDHNTSIEGKDYKSIFQNLGSQFGFITFYPVAGNFHVGLLPSFSTYTYNYNTANSWFDPDLPEMSINQIFNHKQKLRYVEIPLVARYYFGTAALKPYLHGIFSYGILHSADKIVDSEINITQGETPIPINSMGNSASYNNSYITSKLDIGGGAGISYDFNQLILTLDLSYVMNLNNITNEKARYDNPNFTGASYDIQDDIKLNNLFINLGLIFPINKITKRGSVECTYFKTRK